MNNKGSIALLTVGLLLAVCANATIIAEHSGATNPINEGFAQGNGSAVINDQGLGINAWNVGGSLCCGDDFYYFTGAQLAEVDTTDWVFSVYLRDLSTDTSGSYGPNSYGSGAGVGFDGIRFDANLHTDGHGGQVLVADPFAASPTYDISGLGTNYVLLQVAYDASTKTADYYVNGLEVISGYTGFSNYPFNGVGFGGGDQGGNFNLVELQTNATITGATAPEPSTCALFGLGCLVLAKVSRRKARHRSAGSL